MGKTIKTKKPSDNRELEAKLMAIYHSFELELEKIRNEKNRLLAEIEKRTNDKKIKQILKRIK